MTPRQPYEIRQDDHGIGSVLIPHGPWTSECALQLKLGNVEAVRLSQSAGFLGGDISFLADFPGLRSVEVYSTEVRNLDVLSQFSRLEVLGLQTTATTTLSMQASPALRVALVQWRKGMEGLLSVPSLEYLNVMNYPYTSLRTLAQLNRLARLSITSRKLESLDGIEDLSALVELDLYSCPNLSSLAPARNHPNRVKLEVEACRHVCA